MCVAISSHLSCVLALYRPTIVRDVTAQWGNNMAGVGATGIRNFQKLNLLHFRSKELSRKNVVVFFDGKSNGAILFCALNRV